MYEGGLNFALGDDIETLRGSARRFARERIAPLAAAIDRSNEFPMDLWKEMGDLGLLGITADEDYGGLGLGSGEADSLAAEVGLPVKACGASISEVAGHRHGAFIGKAKALTVLRRYRAPTAVNLILDGESFYDARGGIATESFAIDRHFKSKAGAAGVDGVRRVDGSAGGNLVDR